MTIDNNNYPNENTNPSQVSRRITVPGKSQAPGAPPPAPTEAGKEGEGGNSPPGPAPVSNAEFVALAIQGVAEGARAAVCSKAGDPNTGGWTALAATDVDRDCPSHRNNYLNCASLFDDPTGPVRARKEHFAALHFVVLDDVGTKVDRSKLESFTPTWEIETSPGNFQVGIRLAHAITDVAAAERLVDAISAAGLGDPGANGVVRWFRLPKAINDKPKHRITAGEPFACRLSVWNPDVSYTPEELCEALGLASALQAGVLASAQIVAASVPSATERGDDVFTPKPAQNPVIAALQAQGLYKQQLGPGRHEVTCPWCAEHTDQLDTGAAYFEPSDEFPVGGFCCQHSHRDEYHIGELLRHLGVSPADARFKARIRLVPGEINRINVAAEKALARRGMHYQSGGIIQSVWTDPSTGDISLLTTSEQALTKELAAAADWERYDKGLMGWVRCDPPARNVTMLYKAQSFDHLPPLAGLARQPYFRDDGTLVSAPGYDPLSKRFACFDPEQFGIGEPTRQAAEAALDLLSELIDEFHFASPVDRSAALAAILTAVARPSLELAPAFHVRAPTMGSGKSYLCATIAAFATPGDSLRVTFPKASEEATKSMLSLLLTGPAVIEFDDMDSDWIPHGIINRMLTSSSITDRILGVSRTATVGTRTLFLASGNNVGPVRDLTRRVLTIHLDAQTEAPATLTYKGKPAETVRADRGRYVAAALCIIQAWKLAGEPKTDVPSIASYDQWSDYCRHSLIWLGQPDPAGGLLDQIRSAPAADGLGVLQAEWFDAFGVFPTTIRQALKHCEEPAGQELREAIEDLPVMDRDGVNKSRLGWYLRKNAGRVVNGMAFRAAPTSERNAWSVVEVGGGAEAEPPPSPGSPPFSGPDARGEEAGVAESSASRPGAEEPSAMKRDSFD